METNASSSDAAETKCIITGLITSNPKRTTIKQLCQDFVEIVGYKIPLERLGFPNVEQYLRSIPDIVEVFGSGASAEVKGIIQAKSAHIKLMVAKQRKRRNTSTHKNFRKSSFQPQYSNAHGNFLPPEPIHECYQPPGNFLPPQPFCGSYQPITYNPGHVKFTSNSSLQNEKVQNNQENDRQFKTNEAVPAETLHSKIPRSYEPITHIQPLMKFESHGFLQNREVENTPENTEKFEVNELQSEKTIPQDVSTSESKIDKIVSKANGCRVPKNVQSNLKELLVEFPDGILCTILPRVYKTKFKKVLNYEQYNYRSLMEMCSDLPHIFKFQTVFGDFLLFDKDRTEVHIDHTLISPATVVKEETVISTTIFREIPKDDDIVGKILIPPDVLQISDQIPRCFPADLKVGDIMEISVGEIFDLSKFWVYETFGDLVSLMKRLQAHFAAQNDRYLIPEVLLEEGLYCVSLFKHTYHRAIIVNVLPNVPDSVRVFFVDYGTVENVFISQVWFLPKKFANVHCQAIRARLSSICPIYENQPWSSDAIAKFEQLTENRDVVAEVTKIDEENHVVEVYLADITKKENIFYINDVLVNQGFALYVDQEQKKSPLDDNCVPKFKYLHLYPEFCEIESGMAPTPEERKYIIDKQVPLYHYMPHYFRMCYPENIKRITTMCKEFNRKPVKSELPTELEESKFDFSFFPDCLRKEIKDLVRDKDNSGDENEPENSVKEYFCNRKRLSKLNLGSISDSSEGNSSRDISNQDFDLGKSFSQLNLNNSVCTTSNNTTKSSKSSNPFCSDSFNDTNPFRNTNPFLCDLEESQDLEDYSRIFEKPPDAKLPEKIVNNLNISPIKLNNVEKETNSLNLTAQNQFGETNLFKSTETNDRKQVRTPPGFSSTHSTQQGVAWNSSCYMPNFSTFPYQFQPNAFYMPNLGLSQAMGGFAQPSAFQYYPNQLYLDPARQQQLQLQLMRLQYYQNSHMKQ